VTEGSSQSSLEQGPQLVDVRSFSSRVNFSLVRSTLVAALGGLLFGFDTAVIAGTTRALSDTYFLSAGALGFTVSVALWGTVVGALFAGVPGDRIGRRDSLRGMALLYLVSALGCAFAWDWFSLLFFRFLGGLGVGGSSVLGPIYIAEIAPAKWRGRLVAFFQLNVVFGILSAFLSNYLIGAIQLGKTEWRWKLGVEAVPAALFFLLLFGIPRSPRWLVKQGRLTEAREVLLQVGEKDVDQQVSQIVASIEADYGHADEPLFSQKHRMPIFLAVSIGMFNQLSGINAILYYLNDIFDRAGFSKVSGDLQAVMIGVTNLISTLIAMSVIDRIGRKTLLLIGLIGTGLCLLCVSTIFFTGRNQHLLVWLLVGYIAFFAVSQGAVIWVYISEIFPNRVRAKGQSLGSLAHWLMNALVSGVFPIMAGSTGAYPFVFFASMMAVQFFVVWYMYPETKGVPLEQMHKQLGMSQ
jgi:MFS transporter, SP family, arabinose:H+ symporter